MVQISVLFAEYSGLSAVYQLAILSLQSLYVCAALFTGFLVCFDDLIYLFLGLV